MPWVDDEPKYRCDLCDKPTMWVDDLMCGSTFGQLKIICRECAETHEVVIRKKLTPRPEESEG